MGARSDYAWSIRETDGHCYSWVLCYVTSTPGQPERQPGLTNGHFPIHNPRQPFKSEARPTPRRNVPLSRLGALQKWGASRRRDADLNLKAAEEPSLRFIPGQSLYERSPKTQWWRTTALNLRKELWDSIIQYEPVGMAETRRNIGYGVNNAPVSTAVRDDRSVFTPLLRPGLRSFCMNSPSLIAKWSPLSDRWTSDTHVRKK